MAKFNVIQTKEFAFTKEQYFEILFRNSLKKNWWASVFLLVIAGYQLSKGLSLITWLLTALPFVFLGYLAVRSWTHVISKQNKLFFKKRAFEIDDQNLTCRFTDGGINKIELKKIIRVIKGKKYYQLFLSKKQFIYLPLKAFHSSEDLNRFESLFRR